MVKINTIGSKVAKDIINLAYILLDDGKDRRDTRIQMFRIADGGIAALNKIYFDTGDLDIFALIKESEQIWPKRIKELRNV